MNDKNILQGLSEKQANEVAKKAWEKAEKTLAELKEPAHKTPWLISLVAEKIVADANRDLCGGEDVAESVDIVKPFQDFGQVLIEELRELRANGSTLFDSIQGLRAVTLALFRSLPEERLKEFDGELTAACAELDIQLSGVEDYRDE